jgi:arabinogalactan oligomer/maltooligosaccharide transport system permease protein
MHRQRSLWELLPIPVTALIAAYLLRRGVTTDVPALAALGALFVLLTVMFITREIALRAPRKGDGLLQKIQPFFLSRGREDSPFKRFLIHLALITASIIALYPALRVFSISLRPGQQLVSTDLRIIPEGATLEHYREVMFGDPETGRKGNFFLWTWNSLIITLSTAFIGVVIAAMAGYAFSRFKFRGRRAGMVFFLTTQMIPAGMLLLPLWLMLANLKLTDTYLGMIIAYSVSSVPFSIWILKGYYDTIPFDLEEAAMIDGASQLGAFWRILIPLSIPALVIVFLFNFMAAWSEYMVANVIIKDPMMRTWPLGLSEFAGAFQTSFGRFAATSILVAVPVMILFLYSAKWLISGLTLGSVKG